MIPHHNQHPVRNSIIISSLRAFFIALFGIVGVSFGFICVFMIIALISDSTGPTIETTYTVEIVPNGQGVRSVQSSKSPVILKLNILGLIGTEALDMHTIRHQLLESREGTLSSDRVKAVLLHIKSPGGTVTDSDSIYHTIKQYKERYRVPVYAYIDGMCASGGMYIAASADRIYASPVSLIGSIGVVSPPFMNAVGLMDKLGVDALTISAGKDKDALNPLRKWKPDEDANIKSIIEQYYSQFIDVIVANRHKVTRDQLINEYGAHVFLAAKAAEIGYIDVANASLEDTIRELARKIGIDNDYYQVVQLQKKSWYSELMKGQSPLATGKLTHRVDFGPAADPDLAGKFLYLYQSK